MKRMAKLKIGPYTLENNLILAPMAGVTDRPFRQLCRQFGAGLVVSEMVSSNPLLQKTRKTQLRMDHSGEGHPRAVQIVGGDAEIMADAARYNVDQGAEIIDINMGCPAKKVCKKAAGSALLQDERLVKQILQATVKAVNVPVTLKIRTGWDLEHKNGVNIAKIAQDCGIQALAVHGRTRACRFQGPIDYETITQIKQAIHIPVIANGDILTPQDAKKVLQQTQADGIMIGRAAQGSPWIFQQIQHYLSHESFLQAPKKNTIKNILLSHLDALYAFYGDYLAPRIARKHVTWYCQQHAHAREFRKFFNTLTDYIQQYTAITNFFQEAH